MKIFIKKNIFFIITLLVVIMVGSFVTSARDGTYYDPNNSDNWVYSSSWLSFVGDENSIPYLDIWNMCYGTSSTPFNNRVTFTRFGSTIWSELTNAPNSHWTHSPVYGSEAYQYAVDSFVTW